MCTLLTIVQDGWNQTVTMRSCSKHYHYNQLSTANALTPTSLESLPSPCLVTTKNSILELSLKTLYTRTSFPLPVFFTASITSLYCPFRSQSNGSVISTFALAGSQCSTNRSSSSVQFNRCLSACASPHMCLLHWQELDQSHLPSSGRPSPFSHANDTGTKGSSESDT